MTLEEDMDQLKELIPKCTALIDQYDDVVADGDEAEFERTFDELAEENNGVVFRLMRGYLSEMVGENRLGIYPAAGRDTEFPLNLGGRWVFVDLAYNNRQRTVTKTEKGRRVFTAKAITHSYFSDDLPPGVEPGSFDVSLIRNPFGEDPGLNRRTGCEGVVLYVSPDDPVDEEGDFFLKKRIIRGLLKHTVEPMRPGGVLLTEIDMDAFYSEEYIRPVMEPFYSQLEDGSLRLPIFEYRQRQGVKMPRIFYFVGWIKK
ncbi:MAG: hypothetical protein JSV63_01520 [Candidatus Aenigmatarchaeota archaeon]|nr:MAG: hypothetical protein JSV63_01520 [Candidatus Aenigmarchaeota archaeon]